MFKKILIANRGEIALRIIRACRELEIASVAVYSEADAASLHVRFADESRCIGPAPSSKSYLDVDAVVRAAKESRAEAIHPGYGYLAEKESFADRCAAEGIHFIGPTADNLRMAGDKIAAKRVMAAAGVPVIPSSPDGVADLDEALAVSRDIGFPVMIKAAGGGGGRGIRVCANEKELREEFSIARAEATASFGDNSVYIEKCITGPRHIEFQIVADAFGRTTHLGERECTIQRRYQKLIEEAPSPALDETLRAKMGRTAVAAAEAVGYCNAGTVEFLLDSDGRFYFMEINARIQVEHPVTELTTGIDLVKEQIRLADGGRLDYGFEDLKRRGWAIECRINAEDPERNFLPSPGKVERYHPPAGFGVRLDTHLYQGYELPIYYDSLIAKLVTFDLSRGGAIAVMKRALAEFDIHPLKTTIPLYRRIMEDPAFCAGEFDTGFIRKFVPEEEEEEDDD